jgi:hypothetical protein
MTTDQTFVFALKREADKADAMHLASLKTAEKLADEALVLWCTGQRDGAAATMKAIIAWSQQMQSALRTRTGLTAHISRAAEQLYAYENK